MENLCSIEEAIKNRINDMLSGKESVPFYAYDRHSLTILAIKLIPTVKYSPLCYINICSVFHMDYIDNKDSCISLHQVDSNNNFFEIGYSSPIVTDAGAKIVSMMIDTLASKENNDMNRQIDNIAQVLYRAYNLLFYVSDDLEVAKITALKYIVSKTRSLNKVVDYYTVTHPDMILSASFD